MTTCSWLDQAVEFTDAEFQDSVYGAALRRFWRVHCYYCCLLFLRDGELFGCACLMVYTFNHWGLNLALGVLTGGYFTTFLLSLAIHWAEYGSLRAKQAFKRELQKIY